MNDLELKRFVERAVRPVQAEFATKLRMREELLAHATDVLEQELDRNDGDRPAALGRTFARLGNPADLTAEYQAVVPRHERWAARISNHVERRAAGSRLRLAALLSLYCIMLYGIMMVVVVPVQLAELLEWTPRAQITVRFLASLLFFDAANIFVFTLLISAMREHIEPGHGLARRNIFCGVAALAAGTMIVLTGWGLTLFVGGNLLDSWAAMKFWLPLAALAVPGSILIAWLTAIEYRRKREWLELEIDS